MTGVQKHDQRARHGKRGRGGGRGAGSYNFRKSSRGAPVVYDPEAHTEYVTGFRRRKQARRLEAQHKAAVKEKETLRDARRERKEFFRETAERVRGVASPDGNASDAHESDAVRTAITEYSLGGGEAVVSTVVTSIDTDADTTFIKSKIGSGAPIEHKYSRKNPLTKDIANTKRIASGLGKPMKKKSRKGDRLRALLNGNA